MNRFTGRVRAAILAIPLRERLALAAAMAAGFAIVLAFVILQRHAPLRGDELEYNREGNFFVDGRWWWSSTPYGVAHASAWKVPIYPAWVGFWYSLLGASAFRVELIQTVIAPLTVLLSWALCRRLFGPRVAIATAFVVALFPLGWQYLGLLYPEALAVPLALTILLIVLDRTPSARRAVVAGLVIGFAILVRPNFFMFLAVAGVAWIVASGWRRGLGLTALATLMAVLAVAPWTIRNTLTDTVGFLPLSVQDGAIYGTFNPEAASDPNFPWAWRPILRNPPPVLQRKTPVRDADLHSKLFDFGWDYIKRHPSSIVKAFYWNGVRRFWDLQSPGDVLVQTQFDGTTSSMMRIGIWMYYVLLVLSLIGLWMIRRRRVIVLPMLTLGIASSVVFTIEGATRYRAPLEPLIVMFAMVAAVRIAELLLSRLGQAKPAPAPTSPGVSSAELTPTR